MKLKYIGLLLFVFLLGIAYSQSNPDAIITFAMPRTYDAYRSYGNEFTITVKNDGSVTLNNVSIALSGIPENSYSILPGKLDNLDVDQYYSFSVSLYPENMTSGIHDLNVTIKSDETFENVVMTINSRGYDKETGELLNKKKEAGPAFETIKNTLLAITILSGAILIITCLRAFFASLYLKKEKE